MGLKIDRRAHAVSKRIDEVKKKGEHREKWLSLKAFHCDHKINVNIPLEVSFLFSFFLYSPFVKKKKKNLKATHIHEERKVQKLISKYK